MKYKARTNGNIVELSEEAAEILVPSVYERIEDAAPKGDDPPKTRKPRR